MEIRQFMERSHLDSSTLNAWIEAKWLLPVFDKAGSQFSEADLARVMLIWDLKRDFGVNDQGVAIILHLLDQLYGLRSLLRDIQDAGAREPDTADR